MGHLGRKSGSLIGRYLREKREAVGLSQRALGQKFNPPVTTQFISNVERGVTPLPPGHIPTLSRELRLSEGELMTILEKDYVLKLSDKVGHSELADMASRPLPQALLVEDHDFEWMRSLYDALKAADPKTREDFRTLCEKILHMTK